MEDYLKDLRGGMNKFNIIFTTSAPLGDEEWDEEWEEEDDDEEIVITSDDEEEKTDDKKFKKGDKVFVKLKDWDKKYPGKIIKQVKKEGLKYNKYNIELDQDEDSDTEYEPVLNVPENKLILKQNKRDEDETLKELEQLVKAKNKGSKALLKKFTELSEKKKRRIKKKKEKQTKKS